MDAIARLNDAFAIEGHVAFASGRGGMPRAVVSNRFAMAEVYLHGAHVAAFQPLGHAGVLWMSEHAEFRAGKAIRGGIPLVWPWFGPHPTDASQPQHGVARLAEWHVAATRALHDGRTELAFALADHGATPEPFALELGVTVGASLVVSLTSRNVGASEATVAAALHTYLHVGDVARIAVDGLDGCEYVDQLDAGRRHRQQGAVTFDGEVDRVYLETADDCVVYDPVLGRRIRVAKLGSRSTVVWNPWVEKARRMADFPDAGYAAMVCVEVANAAGDARRIRPGDAHTLAQTVSVEAV